MKLLINGRHYEYEGDPEQPLLWVIRDEIGLTGTKFGCGIGQCGTCTIHVDGRARRACMTPVAKAEGRSIVTIEGLSEAGDHPVQRAWTEEDVPQCGYCQAGQIMAAADLLTRIPDPSDEQIDEMHTNICRCGTYYRMRKAIHRAATYMREED
jgi:aerobic-type carbon monoxide dehydrogenase small subunit (CoxS/CutS family)